MTKRRAAGEGSLHYRRHEKRWCASLLIEENGNQRRRAFYGKTRQVALEKLNNAKRAYRDGTLVRGDPRQTVQQFLEQWLETVHQGAVQPHIYRQDAARVRNHIFPALGSIALQKLSAQHVAQFYRNLLDAGFAPKTVHHIHSHLHNALETAVQWDLVARNVCDAVKLPRLPHFDSVTLSVEEATRLIDVAHEEGMGALMHMALSTGMRKSELRGLKWGDINLLRQTLSIARSVTFAKGLGTIEVEPKTATSRRTLPLPDELIAALLAHRTLVKEQRLKAGPAWQERDLVFPNSVGNYLDTANLQFRFKRLLRKAGLSESIRFHDLRHSAATYLMSLGVPPRVIMDILGHATIKMTMEVYSHPSPGMQSEAMKKLGELLG